MRTVTSAFAALLLSLPALAQDRPNTGPPPIRDIEINTANSPYGIGVGLVVGDPTGLSVIWRADDTNALQLGVGWSFLGSDLDIALDYQITVARARTNDVKNAHFNAYAGIGADLDLFSGRNNDAFALGVRVPLGVAFLPDQHPFDVFLQVTPIVLLYPATAAGVEAGIGGRIFF